MIKRNTSYRSAGLGAKPYQLRLADILRNLCCHSTMHCIYLPNITCKKIVLNELPYDIVYKSIVQFLCLPFVDCGKVYLPMNIKIKSI